MKLVKKASLCIFGSFVPLPYVLQNWFHASLKSPPCFWPSFTKSTMFWLPCTPPTRSAPRIELRVDAVPVPVTLPLLRPVRPLLLFCSVLTLRRVSVLCDERACLGRGDGICFCCCGRGPSFDCIIVKAAPTSVKKLVSWCMSYFAGSYTLAPCESHQWHHASFHSGDALCPSFMASRRLLSSIATLRRRLLLPLPSLRGLDRFMCVYSVCVWKKKRGMYCVCVQKRSVFKRVYLFLVCPRVLKNCEF